MRCPNFDYYPIPPHKQDAFKEFNNLSFPLLKKLNDEIISIPISPEMSEADVNIVIDSCNSFKK